MFIWWGQLLLVLMIAVFEEKISEHPVGEKINEFRYKIERPKPWPLV